MTNRAQKSIKTLFLIKTASVVGLVRPKTTVTSPANNILILLTNYQLELELLSQSELQYPVMDQQS